MRQTLIYIAVGARTAGAIPAAYSVLSLANTVLFGMFRRYQVYRFTRLTLILLLPWLMTISLGGFHNSSAVILWSTLCPLGAHVVHDLRTASRWFWVFLILLAGNALLQSPGGSASLSSSMVTFFYILNIGCVLGVVFGMLYYFVDKKNLFQARSEMLLLNILPIEISNILKGEYRTIADHYDEASILFADVVQWLMVGGQFGVHGPFEVGPMSVTMSGSRPKQYCLGFLRFLAGLQQRAAARLERCVVLAGNFSQALRRLPRYAAAIANDLAI